MKRFVGLAADRIVFTRETRFRLMKLQILSRKLKFIAKSYNYLSKSLCNPIPARDPRAIAREANPLEIRAQRRFRVESRIERPGNRPDIPDKRGKRQQKSDHAKGSTKHTEDWQSKLL